MADFPGDVAYRNDLQLLTGRREHTEEVGKVSEEKDRKVRRPDNNQLQTYKGCKTIFPFSLSISNLAGFQANPGDVCVAGVPKAGTTMTCAIVYMVLHDDDPNCLRSGVPLKHKVPMIEMAYPREGSYENALLAIDQLAAITDRPRVYTTHWSTDALPEQVLQTTKFVYVYRNPKDTIVSLYHFWRAMHAKATGTDAKIAGTIEAVLADQTCSAPLFGNIESFWKLRHQPNILLISFEDIVEKPRDSVGKISRFLGKDLSDAQMDNILSECSFEVMKDNEVANSAAELAAHGFDQKVSPFLRAGKIGNWRQSLTAEESDVIDKWTQENFATRPGLNGLTFQYD